MCCCICAPNAGDFLHEFADRIVLDLAEWLDLLEVVHGFRYQDGRDLTGFVVHSAPVGDERARVALVGVEDADWAGGSYVCMCSAMCTGWRREQAAAQATGGDRWSLQTDERGNA